MNRVQVQRATLIAAALAVAAMAAAAGYLLGARNPSPAVTAPAGEPSGSDRRVLYWYDPMVPQQHFDRPGKSPFMDMALVPRYADGEAEAATPAVHVDAQASQQLGMREVRVQRTPLATRIDAIGTIELDGHSVTIVQARSNGFVERVWQIAAGDTVAAGAPLVTLRLPEWKASAEEWLILAAADDAATTAAATERLRQQGMAASDIDRLARSRRAAATYTLAAPVDALVREVLVRDGMVVTTGQTLFAFNGIERVWVRASVPELGSASIRVGDPVQVTLPALPGRTFSARVGAVLPELDPATRTVQVRIPLPNPARQLRPGLSALVRIDVAGGGTMLTVPTEALIRTGKRTVVMLAQAAGRYRPVAVQTGRETGERTEVLSGLSEGQHIVASGQFLIDSEASLLGVVPEALAEPASGPRTGTSPSGHAAAARAAAATSEQQEAAAAEVHQADARVVAIEGSRITLAHGPFRTLGMAGMTMTFPLQSQGHARGIQPGDRVSAGVVQTPTGLMVVRLARTGAAR